MRVPRSGSATAAPTSLTLRERWIVAIGIAVVVLCYVPAVLAPSMGLYHDDGIYVVTAKALAEGHGYRILSLPGEIYQTKYPVLFPWLLSLVWRLHPSFPENLWLLKLVPFLATLVWALLVHRVILEESKRSSWAIGIAFLTLASPMTFFHGTMLLSETVFAALLWASLLGLGRAETRDGGTIRVAIAGILCAATFHTRTLGVVAVLAGVASLGLSKQWKKAGAFLATALILIAPWVAWTMSVEGGVSPIEAYYTGGNYQDWNVLPSLDPGRIATVAWVNAALAWATVPFFLGIQGLAAGFLGLVPMALLVLGILASIRRSGPRAIHFLLPIYVAALLIWQWPPFRFMLPLVPLVLYFALLGLSRVVDEFRKRWMHPVLTGGLVLVGLATGWTLGDWSVDPLEEGKICGDRECGMTWSEIETTLRYLDRTIPADAVLIGNPDPMLYLYTGRKAIRSFEADPYRLYYAPLEEGVEPLGSAETLMWRIEESGADYLVSFDLQSEEPHLRAQLRKVVSRRPERFERVPVPEAPRVLVFEIE